MWVLSTDYTELKFFDSPECIPGGYAILSHVWDKNEQSFEDVRQIGRRCQEDGTNPRDFVSPKIRNCCMLAERHGYRWLWVDTCCVDKTSSMELSEAINSMFRYYALSAICYVYLHDVPSGDTLYDNESAFRTSRWHKRGWTLQELIAPKFVVFLDNDWKLLVYKADLAPLLEQITRVPSAILLGHKQLSDFSIAQRMSWAATRKTRRIEDEAHCLLGIFGVHMQILYGEGRNAFRRLQEEIMKQSIDRTLFAWGAIWPNPSQRPVTLDLVDDHLSGLLAPSVHEFRNSGQIHFVRDYPAGQQQRGPVEGGVYTFTLTPRGIVARMPVMAMGEVLIGDLGVSLGTGLRRLGLIIAPSQ